MLDSVRQVVNHDFIHQASDLGVVSRELFPLPSAQTIAHSAFGQTSDGRKSVHPVHQTKFAQHAAIVDNFSSIRILDGREQRPGNQQQSTGAG